MAITYGGGTYGGGYYGLDGEVITASLQRTPGGVVVIAQIPGGTVITPAQIGGGTLVVLRI